MKKKWKSLLILGLPYIIIAIFPMVSTICLGNQIINSYHERIISDKQRDIVIAVDRFEQKIDAIEKMSFVIEQSDEISEYVKNKLSGFENSLVECKKIRELLNDFMINNEVTLMYFYDEGNNRIISTTGIYSDASDFFRFGYQIDGYTPEECVENLKKSSQGYEYTNCMGVSIKNEATQVIEYRMSIPLKKIRSCDTQLVVVMKAKDIFGDLYDILEEDNEFYVYDSEERLIYANGTKYEGMLNIDKNVDLKVVTDEEYEIYGTLLDSKDNLWKIKFYIPNLLGHSIHSRLLQYVLLLIVIPILISALLCVYFTYKNHKEIMEILRSLRGQDKLQDGIKGEAVSYKIVKEYANAINKEKNEFVERIEKYEYFRKCEVLDKLIRNAYGSREEKEDALNSINMLDMEGQCCVVCIRYEGSYYRDYIDENLTIKDFVKALLVEKIERRKEIFDSTSRETICIISIDDENADFIMQYIISKMCVEIVYQYGVQVNIGVGSMVKSIYDISRSYEQAREVIKYSRNSGNRLFFYKDMEQLEDKYFYPQTLNEKICNYMIAGDLLKAKESVEKIYKENFEDATTPLSAKVIESLTCMLRDSLISLAVKFDISVDSTLLQLEYDQNIKDWFERIYDCMEIIVDEIANRKKNIQNDSALKIMQYIRENYCDGTISLKHLSQKFGLHEVYISNLFKQEYGVNFSVVIEKLRIEKACELLKNSEMKVSDVAQVIGYASDISFRRSFKKITGISPKEFREK